MLTVYSRVGAPIRVLFALAAVAATLLTFATVTSASVGLTREPVVPGGDSASVFSPFVGLPRVPKDFERSLVGIEDKLGSEHYDVRDYYGANATYTNFVRMARSKVIAFVTHGVLDGGLVVQLESSQSALNAAYAHYVGTGCNPCYDRAWIGHETFDEKNHALYVITITSAGIKHFFSHARLGLVMALSCESARDASNFHALSYIGYTPCVQFINILKDGTNLLARLTGSAGIDDRTTVGAMADMVIHDGLVLLGPDGRDDPTPIVLSPAVVSANSGGSSLPAGNQSQGHIKFDAAMDTTDPSSVITVSGCGATLSEQKWSGRDTLNFTVTMPDRASAGTMTFTVGAHQAKGYPGTTQNDWLDGNQDPGDPSGGISPNGDDYKWEVACDPNVIPLKIQISGTFSENYQDPSNQNPGLGTYTWNSSYNWTVTQYSQVAFRGNAGDITDGSGSQALTGTGTGSGAGGASSCSFTAASSTPNAGVEAATQGVNGPPSYRTISVYADLPFINGSGTGACGSPGPYETAEDTYSPLDGPATLQAADSGQMTVDVAALEQGPVSTTYPISYTATANDGTGTVEHITAMATETISISSN